MSLALNVLRHLCDTFQIVASDFLGYYETVTSTKSDLKQLN